MSEQHLEQYYQVLGVDQGISLNDLQTAYRQRCYQLSRDGAEKQLEQLRHAYEYVLAHLQEHSTQQDSVVSTSAHFPSNTNPALSSSLERINVACPTNQIPAQLAKVNSQGLEHFLNQRLQHHNLSIEVARQDQKLIVRVETSSALSAKVITALIFKALRNIELSEVDRVRVYGIRKGTQGWTVLWKQEFPLIQHHTGESFDRITFNSPLNNALALPMTSLLAIMLNNSFFLAFLLPWQIWIHEFGHATIAWLSGRRATPLPFGWTSWSLERSLFVYFGILTLMVLLFRQGLREKIRWPMILAGTVVVLQILFTWVLPESQIEMWIVFGGIGGEFYLSTLLMISFYFRLPDQWRWDFWRYIALAIAASVVSTFS